MAQRSILILFGGIVLIFLSLFIFTRPAIFSAWDFTHTGQIGDTIGGITAPVINLIGAFLVFISFQAQIKANKIQAEALAEEKNRNATYNLYEKHVSLFEDIKNRLRELEFVVEIAGHYNDDRSYTQTVHITYKGLNALNEFVERIEQLSGTIAFDPFRGQIYSIKGIFLNFQFMLTAICDLIERIEGNIQNINDREFLFKNISLFYKGFLLQYAERIIPCYSPDAVEILELKKLKEVIDTKFGIQ